jgi:hypothetical protein
VTRSAKRKLIPSQGVISEIRMASILRTPCPDSPTCGLQVAYRRLTPGIEERQSKCDRRKNVGVDCKPAVEKGRALASQTLIGEIKPHF